jgi:hypothetical protein
LQRAQNRRPENVTCYSHNEQLAEPGIEDELRWNAAIAATENGGVGFLALFPTKLTSCE